jgi:hypothetical protein
VSPSTSSLDGYISESAASLTEARIYRLDDDSTTQLGSSDALGWTMTTGDKIAIQMIGDQIMGWYKDGASAWSLEITRTDDTYSAAGYMGQERNGADTNDDFYAGTISLDINIAHDNADYQGTGVRILTP